MKTPKKSAPKNSLYPKELNGNSTHIRKDVSVTPLYTTLPLTDYRYESRNGNQKMAISDRKVEQMRDFSIENKK
ncbi:MAG: hypothetical protein IJD13_02115 [Oscillospiraceae bacterium]|nr:hypothetical protein [Oscillospiraceae bacterium]